LKGDFKKRFGIFLWDMSHSYIYYMRLGDYDRELFYKVVYKTADKIYRIMYRRKR
jgi:hypothetical protein